MRSFVLAWLTCALLCRVAHGQDAQAVQGSVTSAAPADQATANTLPPARQQPVLVPLQVAQQYVAGIELMRVEAELLRVDAQRPRVGWPAAIVGLGLLLVVADGVNAVTLASSGEHDADASYEARDAATGIGLGLAIAALGAVFLVPRMRRRRELSLEAEQLKARRKQLRAELGYALNVVPHEGSLVTTLRF